ncbi:hypothetical protein CYMTET_6722 [Cymbomonas tetramitiformis]|uniref:DNA-3-methyladenine glycosylase I n=1 Tax=Cymbomonas tetramitiformis TaxID=36881 RepID=A0AAE0GX02_9CHLO|nr:hypothetical protein CYMTET_6722 [Cymbomonas tetramitiformis]
MERPRRTSAKPRFNPTNIPDRQSTKNGLVEQAPTRKRRRESIPAGASPKGGNPPLKKRCNWAGVYTGADSAEYIKYHDEEWGRPVTDDQVFFEFLTLEGAQAGLSWATILKKRSEYTKAFAQWDVHSVANFTSKQVEDLLKDDSYGIVKNRAKVASVIKNAKHILEVAEEFGSFSKYLWSFVDGKPIINQFESLSDVPAETTLSISVSKDMKRRGFKFVGPKIIYSLHQACGIVNDHLIDCFCYKPIIASFSQ